MKPAQAIYLAFMGAVIGAWWASVVVERRERPRRWREHLEALSKQLCIDVHVCCADEARRVPAPLKEDAPS